MVETVCEMIAQVAGISRCAIDEAGFASAQERQAHQVHPGRLDDAAIVKLMDGTRTVGEIVVDRLRESGELEVAQVAALVRELEAGNFLQTRYVDAYEAVRDSLAIAGSSEDLGDRGDFRVPPLAAGDLTKILERFAELRGLGLPSGQSRAR